MATPLAPVQPTGTWAQQQTALRALGARNAAGAMPSLAPLNAPATPPPAAAPNPPAQLRPPTPAPQAATLPPPVSAAPTAPTPPPLTGPGSLDPTLNKPTAAPTAAASPADDLLKSYLDSLKVSPEEQALQDEKAQLEGAGKQLGINQGISNSNIEGQAIPLGEVTGQEANVAKRYQLEGMSNQNQQQTLQAKLANLQARRQSGVDVSKALLDYQNTQADRNKPFTVAFGGSVFDPKSGQMVADNNSNSDPLISQAIQNGQLTPDMLTRYGSSAVLKTLQADPSFNFVSGLASKSGAVAAATTKGVVTKDAFGNIVQVTPNIGGNNLNGPALGTPSSSSGAYQAGQLTKLLQSQGKPTDDASLSALYKQIGGTGNYVNDTAHNSQIYSALGGAPSSGSGGSGGTTSFPAADAASLKKEQDYADSTQRAFNTANQNLQALVPFMQQAGVNTGSTIPLINSLQTRVKAGLTDAGTIAAFHAALAGLRAEYAQVLSRGGEVTEGQRAQAATLIPDDLSPAQLQQVADRLNIEGSNAVKEANAQIDIIKGRVNGQSSVAPSTGGSTYNGIKLPN